MQSRPHPPPPHFTFLTVCPQPIAREIAPEKPRGEYLYLIFFLHLFYITGHLYYITDLKILFLRFKYRITRINGEGQDIVKLIIT